MRVVCAMLLCATVWAKGTLADPILVDALPYAIKGDTTLGGHDINVYTCATQNESGPERIYQFTLASPAKVTAWVEATAPVDVDVHLLDDKMTCLARGDVIAEAEMTAGTHYVSVDTFTSDAKAGPYVLHLDAMGGEWTSRPLADGVTWRARRFTVAGGQQVVNELVIDPTKAQLKALAATGCQSVGDIGTAAGAIAGTNGGFFDASCAPVALLKASGNLLGKNASQRGAFGLSMVKQPLVDLVAGNADWPAAFEAHGAGPILAQAGAPHMGSAAWGLEGFSSASFLGPNPRTFIGFAGNLVQLGVVDGRRTNAAGMTMDALAVFVSGAEIGSSDAVNMDGGGSSTMWIDGATPNGIVNYPSDGNPTEGATHPGARGVSGGWFVIAPKLNHAPRFQTTPPGDAAVGVPYAYDADAIDLDVDDVVSFHLDAPPPGVTVDADGIVKFLPAADDLPVYGITLVASDGRGGEARQSWLVSIAGATGETDDAGTMMMMAAPDDLAVAPMHGSDTGSGCALAGRSPPVPVFFFLLLFLWRRHA